MKKTYRVEGMSCASCAAAVERVLKKQEHVQQAEVNLITEEAVITTDTKEDLFPQWKQAVEKAGFVLRECRQTKMETFLIQGMSCAACSAAVERVLSRFAEIEKVSVNLLMNNAQITYTKRNIEAWKQAVEKAGFTMLEEQTREKAVFDIGGMSCASCSAAIERVLSKKEGIESAEVNLVMNRAEVVYDKTKIKPSEMIAAIEKAGFQAVLHKEEQATAPQKKEHEKLHIYGTLAVALVLLYVGMSHMLGSFELPLPDIISYKTHPFSFAFVQFVLASIILLSGRHFFVRGSKALLHKAPNMDTLVAIGTGSAYLYSLYSLYRIAMGDVHAVHALYFEGAGVVVALVQFGKHLEKLSKEKSTGAIQALLQLRPSTAVLYRDGKEIEISIKEISVGDILVVKPGDHIAMDGVIVEGGGNVDESMLSGESMPQKKQQNDRVHQGTINLDGRLLIRCDASQEETTLSKIIRMVEDAQGKKAPIARIADRISLVFVPAVMSIALAAALIWYVVNRDIAFSLTIFVSVLVIACPCALGLATPTAIMVGSGKAAQLGIFIKSGEALELASSVDTVVFDKTGTITLGKPSVTDWQGEDEERLLSFTAALEQGSKHPLAAAVLEHVKQKGISYPVLTDISTLNGKGLSAMLEGKELVCGSRTLLQERGYATTAYEQAERMWQESGKTVIWSGYDGTLLGVLAIADKIKEDAREVITRMRESGLDVYMITGDNEITAQAIAKQANISHVIAEVLPQEKGEQVRKLQAQGKRVAMVGDGINDAIALTQSEVGIAIGSGSDVAVESADIVLMKDDLHDVEQAIRLSHAVIRNIRQNLFWAFFYNSIGIPIAAGILYPLWGVLLSPVFAGAAMAFSSVSVVSNALRLRNFK